MLLQGGTKLVVVDWEYAISDYYFFFLIGYVFLIKKKRSMDSNLHQWGAANGVVEFQIVESIWIRGVRASETNFNLAVSFTSQPTWIPFMVYDTENYHEKHVLCFGDGIEKEKILGLSLSETGIDVTDARMLFDDSSSPTKRYPLTCLGPVPTWNHPLREHITEIISHVETWQYSAASSPLTNLVSVVLPNLTVLGIGDPTPFQSLETYSGWFRPVEFDTSKLRAKYTIGHFTTCKKLTRVHMPRVQTFKDCIGTFAECESLRSLHFPMLTEVTGFGCFAHCASLVYLGIPQLKSITSAFSLRVVRGQKLPLLTNFDGSGALRLINNHQDFMIEAIFLVSSNPGLVGTTWFDGYFTPESTEEAIYEVNKTRWGWVPGWLMSPSISSGANNDGIHQVEPNEEGWWQFDNVAFKPMDGKIRYKITDTELEGVIESADTFVHHVQSYTLYYVNTTNADDPVFVQFNIMDYWSDVTLWFQSTQFTVVDLDPTVSTQQVYLDFYDNLKDDVNKPYIYFTDDYRNYRHIVDSARDMEHVENNISETVSSFVTNTTEWTPPTGTGLTRGRVFKDFIRTRLTKGPTTAGEFLTLTKTQLQELITLPKTAKFSQKMDEDVITLRIMSNEQAVTILGNETVYIPFSTISEIHVGSHVLQVEVQADTHTYHVKQKVPGSTRFEAVEMNESATHEGATFTMELKSNGQVHTVTFVWNSILVDVVTTTTTDDDPESDSEMCFSACAGADPYVFPCLGPALKLPNVPAIYRLYQDATVIINARVAPASTVAQAQIAAAFAWKDSECLSLVAAEAFFFSELYISTVDQEHHLHADLVHKKIQSKTSFFTVGAPFVDTSPQRAYEMINNDTMSRVSIHVHWPEMSTILTFSRNPQVRNGISLQGIHPTCSTGLLVRNYRPKLFVVTQLTNTCPVILHPKHRRTTTQRGVAGHRESVVFCR
jgi:hypothetical protein